MKTLPVWRNVIRATGVARQHHIAFLYDKRRRRRRPRWAGRHAGGHQGARWRDVNEFPPAWRPDWPGATSRGYLPAAAVQFRKGARRLELARVLIRLIRQPLTIGRDDPVPLGELGLNEGRDAARAIQWELHDVRTGLRRCLGEDQRVAVSRDARRDLQVGTLGQLLRRASAVSGLREQIASAVLCELKISRWPSGVHTGE